MAERKWKEIEVATSMGDQLKAAGIRITHPKTEKIRQTQEETFRKAKEAEERVKQRNGGSSRFIPVSTLPVASSFKK